MKKLLTIIFLTVALVAGHADAQKKSYSSGSSSSSSKSYSSSSSKSNSSSGSTGSKYSSGSASSDSKKSKSYSSDSKDSVSKQSVGSKPTGSSGFAGSIEQKQKNSSDAYKAANQPKYTPSPQPKTSYTDEHGKSKPIQKSPEVDYLRGRLDGERYANRQNRIQNIYGSRYDYYNSRPYVYYDDHYSRRFHYWILDQTPEMRGDYIYNHRYSMDPVRYSLYMSDPLVAARVNYLESVHYTRNAYWAPSGWDYDCMLDDGYVGAVYNPTSDTVYSSGPYIGFGRFFAWFFGSIVALCVLAFAVWLIFINDTERNY